MDGTRNDTALEALKEQGFEIVETVLSEEGRVLIGVRSKDDSALVEIGQDLWDLAAARLTLAEINARRRPEE